MEETSRLIELSLYAAVMTITPGPNNLLLLASGLNFGLRATLWHVGGIVAGVTLQIWGVGAGLGTLFALEPRFQLLLKLVGSLYMAWLALRLWQASELRMRHSASPFRFHQALLFQFINPKAWLMATTVIAAFVPATQHYAREVASTGMVFSLVSVPCILLWAASGARLRHWLGDTARFRAANRTMAVLAVLTILLFWL